MWVHKEKALINTDKILLRAGVYSWHHWYWETLGNRQFGGVH